MQECAEQPKLKKMWSCTLSLFRAQNSQLFGDEALAQVHFWRGFQHQKRQLLCAKSSYCWPDYSVMSYGGFCYRQSSFIELDKVSLLPGETVWITQEWILSKVCKGLSMGFFALVSILCTRNKASSPKILHYFCTSPRSLKAILKGAYSKLSHSILLILMCKEGKPTSKSWFTSTTCIWLEWEVRHGEAVCLGWNGARSLGVRYAQDT